MMNDLKIIDATLNDVHTLLTTWMSKSAGYVLTGEDIDLFEEAEDRLNKIRDAIHAMARKS